MTSDFLAQLRAAKTTPAGQYTLTGSGFVVHLRRWTVGERIRVLALGREKDRSPAEWQAELLALTLCDPANKLLFPVGSAELLELELGADADAIIDAAFAANGWGKGEKKTPEPPTA